MLRRHNRPAEIHDVVARAVVDRNQDLFTPEVLVRSAGIFSAKSHLIGAVLRGHVARYGVHLLADGRIDPERARVRYCTRTRDHHLRQRGRERGLRLIAAYLVVQRERHVEEDREKEIGEVGIRKLRRMRAYSTLTAIPARTFSALQRKWPIRRQGGVACCGSACMSGDADANSNQGTKQHSGKGR